MTILLARELQSDQEQSTSLNQRVIRRLHAKNRPQLLTGKITDSIARLLNYYYSSATEGIGLEMNRILKNTIERNREE